MRADASSRPLDPGLRLAVLAVDPKHVRNPGRVSIVDPTDPTAREDRRLSCERIYEAGGRGLCESIAPSGVDYRVQFLDAAMRPRSSLSLTGVPSRARVSSDGRYVAPKAPGYSIEMHPESLREYAFPGGHAWR